MASSAARFPCRQVWKWICLGTVAMAACANQRDAVGCEAVDADSAASDRRAHLSDDMRRSEIDGMAMVLVPSSEFRMGAQDDPLAVRTEMPQHAVVLGAFWMDQTEVTNRMFASCVAAGGCDPPVSQGSYLRSQYYGHDTCADYPVIHVTWFDSQSYCAWAGRRLPTEAEWEKAARGLDGRVYPWGNDPPTGTLANFCDKNCSSDSRAWDVDDGYVDPAPVGTYPAGASYYGVLDMAGNVSEWVADWSQVDYYSFSPYDNPTGPSSGDTRVVRGGSWVSIPQGLRVTDRWAAKPELSTDAFGFRCAMDGESG